MTLPTDLRRILEEGVPDPSPVPAAAHLDHLAREEAVPDHLAPLARAADQARTQARDRILGTREARRLDRGALKADLDERLRDLRAEAQRHRTDDRLNDAARANLLQDVQVRQRAVIAEVLAEAREAEAKLLKRFPATGDLPAPPKEEGERHLALLVQTRLNGGVGDAALHALTLDLAQEGHHHVLRAVVGPHLRERAAQAGTLVPGSPLHEALAALELAQARAPERWLGSLAREVVRDFRFEAETLVRGTLEGTAETRDRLQVLTS